MQDNNQNHPTLEALLTALNTFAEHLPHDTEHANHFVAFIQEINENIAEKERLLQEGIAFTQQGFFYDAGHSLEAAAALDPLCPRIKVARKEQLVGLARRDRAKKWDDSAQQAYKSALELFPESTELKTELYLYKASVLKLSLRLSQLPQNIRKELLRKKQKHYQTVLEIDPNNREALDGVQSSLRQLKKLNTQQSEVNTHSSFHRGVASKRERVVTTAQAATTDHARSAKQHRK